MDNPYWEEVRTLPGDPIESRFANAWRPHSYSSDYRRETRKELVRKYAWAITDPDSIAFVAAQSRGRIVEIGAGSGYWASLLASSGVNVIAFDQSPPHTHTNHYFEKAQQLWHDVQLGGPEKAADYPDRTLFLCWPPYDDAMAFDALNAYKGSRLIYIGEGSGGCNGCDKFHEIVSNEWKETECHSIIRWSHINDWIWVYDRITASHSPAPCSASPSS